LASFPPDVSNPLVGHRGVSRLSDCKHLLWKTNGQHVSGSGRDFPALAPTNVRPRPRGGDRVAQSPLSLSDQDLRAHILVSLAEHKRRAKDPGIHHVSGGIDTFRFRRIQAALIPVRIAPVRPTNSNHFWLGFAGLTYRSDIPWGPTQFR
jgi:hypothetical protein